MNKIICKFRYYPNVFSSWDASIDDLLLENPVTLNLLYIQTVSDVEMKWIQVPQETEKLLARMQARGAKSEYMDTARGLMDYGYVHFLPCFCDYPRPHTKYVKCNIRFKIPVSQVFDQVKFTLAPKC